MMLAIVRKSLPCLLSNHNSFVCKSSLSFALCSHFLSTLRESQNVVSPELHDLLFHKHHFPPDVASLVASFLKPPRSPEKADSILSLLKESGCSTTQLHKIVKYYPRVVLHSVEDITLKIKTFRELGLSPQDTARMLSLNPVILHLSTKSNIIPSLSVLKGLLGSDIDVARLLRKSGWPLCCNLETKLVPNIEFLKTFGVPMEHIFSILYLHPRFLFTKPDTIRESAVRTKEMGLNETSKMFLYVVRVVASLTNEIWEGKLQYFKDMGFSESDTLTMFKKFPALFHTSVNKIETIKQLLVATGKFNMSSFVKYPVLFGYSVEQRLEPRLRILGTLESKNLIKWPALGHVCKLSDDTFFERYVRPYPSEIVEAFFTKNYVEDKIR